MASTNQPAPATYRPISCSFYDELEARATCRQPCVLRYRDEAGQPHEHCGVLVDFFIRNHAEFLRCADGFELRLDQLLAVDDRELRNYC